jgi:predicted aspartyl protease
MAVASSIVYNYNRQINPPAPLVNVIVRSPEEKELFVASPALVDAGADYSVITPEIFETLMPLRVGKMYIESFQGKGDVFLRYAVDIEIHDWIFRRVAVIVGAKDCVILGRDILNNFDLRLNGIDGKLEFLRGPQSATII